MISVVVVVAVAVSFRRLNCLEQNVASFISNPGNGMQAAASCLVGVSVESGLRSVRIIW